MKKLNKKFVFLAILAGLSVLSVFFILTSTQKKKITTTGDVKISSSIPANESSGFSVFDTVSLTFNQDIDPDSIKIFSEPSETWSVHQISQNSVELEHKLYLRVATKYKIVISYDDKNIGTLNFETASEQNDPRLLQSLQSEMDKNYPLAKETPYETSDYRVVYSAPLTLDIYIKSNISTQEATLKIQSWVRQNGIDPSTHKYTIDTHTK